ncbi:hypothetical protein [Nostoc sp. FACHB-133]|uniref:hypothetical protein n=1 Tax=Nostoc sp. FACHB-133 TaxID=2692835 RepID=UPI0028C4834D|nr:hypothetical protein [Nostoc sp. FACHB-133]
MIVEGTSQISEFDFLRIQSLFVKILAPIAESLGAYVVTQVASYSDGRSLWDNETGMMCDIYLPQKNGNFGGIVWSSSNYNRDAARAILKSITNQKLVRAVFFNDQQLIKERLCVSLNGHDNHIHFEINPPVRS